MSGYPGSMLHSFSWPPVLSPSPWFTTFPAFHHSGIPSFLADRQSAIGNPLSLPHTESREDLSEQIGIGLLPRNTPEPAQRLPQIFCYYLRP
jgi:hypothetical protein